MDETQKLEIGARIRGLRERSPLKQQAVADRLKIGLRAYQKLEEVGTTRYERCQELAQIFDVDPMWIWSGKEKGETPDPFVPSDSSELRQIEEALAELQRQVAWLVAQQKAEAARAEAQEHRQSQRRRRGQGEAGTGS